MLFYTTSKEKQGRKMIHKQETQVLSGPQND